MGSVYVGDSKRESIVRKDEALSCKEPSFDNYVCIKQEDFKDLVNQLLHQCK